MQYNFNFELQPIYNFNIIANKIMSINQKQLIQKKSQKQTIHTGISQLTDYVRHLNRKSLFMYAPDKALEQKVLQKKLGYQKFLSSLKKFRQNVVRPKTCENQQRPKIIQRSFTKQNTRQKKINLVAKNMKIETQNIKYISCKKISHVKLQLVAPLKTQQTIFNKTDNINVIAYNFPKKNIKKLLLKQKFRQHTQSHQSESKNSFNISLTEESTLKSPPITSSYSVRKPLSSSTEKRLKLFTNPYSSNLSIHEMEKQQKIENILDNKYRPITQSKSVDITIRQKPKPFYRFFKGKIQQYKSLLRKGLTTNVT